MQLPDVYIQTDNSRANVQTWMNATYISDAAPSILPVSGRRLTEKFRRNNVSHGFKYTPGGRLPPRAGRRSGDASPEKKETSLPAAAAPTSPSRKIVADFKPFGSAGGSVFGAPMVPTGPGGGMFGSAGRTPIANAGMRSRDADDDEDDEDEGTQLKREAISLDQARRIATQSVFRAGRLPL